MKKKLLIMITMLCLVWTAHSENIITVGGGVSLVAAPWGYIYDDVSEFSAKFGGNVMFSLAILTEVGKTKQYYVSRVPYDYPRRNAVGFAVNLGYGVFGGPRFVKNVTDEAGAADFGFLGHSAVADLDFCYKTYLSRSYNDCMIQVGLSFKPEIIREIIRFTMPTTYLFAPQTGINLFIGGDLLYRADGNKNWMKRYEKPQRENMQITVGARIRAMVGPLCQSDYGIVAKDIVGTIEVCAEIALGYYNHF